jgi:hypothetical protein
VVITATFIGYLTAGFTAAVVATVAIFIPIYLGVVLPGRWFVRHKDNLQVQAFVKGATAAAAGALTERHRRARPAGRRGPDHPGDRRRHARGAASLQGQGALRRPGCAAAGIALH